MKSGVRKRDNRSGFTMIEIIAVLVIIAVLAAVAIPKFLSLINDAREKALDGAVAAGMSQCSLSFGKLCLQNAAAPTGADIATDATANAPAGDFTFTFAVATEPNVTVTVTDAAGTTTNKVWYRP